HPVGDQEPADHIDGGGGDRDGAEDGAERAVPGPRQDQRADQRDPRDRVGQRHQRGVQQGRHPADDLVPEEGGQDEYVQPDLDPGGHPGLPFPPSDDEAAEAGSRPPSSPRAWRIRGCTTSPPRAARVSRVISSSRSSSILPSATRWSRKDEMFLAYIWLAWNGTVEGRLV